MIYWISRKMCIRYIAAASGGRFRSVYSADGSSRYIEAKNNNIGVLFVRNYIKFCDPIRNYPDNIIIILYEYWILYEYYNSKCVRLWFHYYTYGSKQYNTIFYQMSLYSYIEVYRYLYRHNHVFFMRDGQNNDWLKRRRSKIRIIDRYKMSTNLNIDRGTNCQKIKIFIVIIGRYIAFLVVISTISMRVYSLLLRL